MTKDELKTLADKLYSNSQYIHWDDPEHEKYVGYSTVFDIIPSEPSSPHIVQLLRFDDDTFSIYIYPAFCNWEDEESRDIAIDIVIGFIHSINDIDVHDMHMEIDKHETLARIRFERITKEE